MQNNTKQQSNSNSTFIITTHLTMDEKSMAHWYSMKKLDMLSLLRVAILHFLIRAKMLASVDGIQRLRVCADV